MAGAVSLTMFLGLFLFGAQIVAGGPHKSTDLSEYVVGVCTVADPQDNIDDVRTHWFLQQTTVRGVRGRS